MQLLTLGKKILKEALLVAALLVMGVASVLGSPTSKSVTEKFGHFVLTSSSLGIGLHQNEPYTSYVFNAYNDYLILADGTRLALVPFDDTRFNVKTAPNPVSEKLLSYIASYFDIAPPSNQFSKGYQMLYETAKEGNSLLVRRKVINYPNAANVRATGATILYSRDDLVFASDGTLYTENSDSVVGNLAKIYGVKLVKHTQLVRRPQVNGGRLYLVNPRVAGVLVMMSEPNQRVFVNKDYRLIEVEAQINQPAETEITLNNKILYFDTLTEAMKYE